MRRSKTHAYLITCSARASSDGGTTRPSALAVRPAQPSLFPLHIERDRDVFNTLAGFDHVLGCLRIFLEVRRFRMGSGGIGIRVNLEQSNPCRIFLFKDRIGPEASGLDSNSRLLVLLNRCFISFQLWGINLKFTDHDKCSG